MQFAAVFVEYLVTGCGAMFWILPLLGVSLEDLHALQPGHVTLLLPLVYVIGMYVDITASVVLHRVKKHARRRGLPWRKADESDRGCEFSRTAFVTLHSPELGTAVQLRTSRDRIARGAWLNLVFTAAIAILQPIRVNYLLPGPVIPQPLLSGVTILLAIGAFIGWWYQEYQTHRFKLRAFRVIRDKLGLEKIKST